VRGRRTEVLETEERERRAIDQRGERRGGDAHLIISKLLRQLGGDGTFAGVCRGEY
jgi:hypothetical protein